MTKLAKIILTAPFDIESEEYMLKSNVLIAGKGRTRELPSRVVPVPDIELDDDADHRRVFVRIPGRLDTFVPYEHVQRGIVAAIEAPKLVAQAGKNRK